MGLVEEAEGARRPHMPVTWYLPRPARLTEFLWMNEHIVSEHTCLHILVCTCLPANHSLPQLYVPLVCEQGAVVNGGSGAYDAYDDGIGSGRSYDDRSYYDGSGRSYADRSYHDRSYDGSGRCYDDRSYYDRSYDDGSGGDGDGGAYERGGGAGAYGDRGGGSSAGGYPERGGYSERGGNLPPPWTTHVSTRTGKPYWYNTETQSTTWTCPIKEPEPVVHSAPVVNGGSGAYDAYDDGIDSGRSYDDRSYDDGSGRSYASYDRGESSGCSAAPPASSYGERGDRAYAARDVQDMRDMRDMRDMPPHAAPAVTLTEPE